ARRAALHALVALVACGQAIAALELAGVPLRPPNLVLGLEGVVVVAAIVAALRRPAESADLRWWGAIGLGVWVIWGTLYFGAARITDPPNARTFDDAILSRLPLVPAF